jgi:hypothetical protein
MWKSVLESSGHMERQCNRELGSKVVDYSPSSGISLGHHNV